MADEITKTTAPAAGLSVTDKLRLLLDITKKISRSLNVEEVLALVMDTLDSLLPYDAAGIYIIRRDPHVSEGGTHTLFFHAEAVRGYDLDELLELRLKAGEGLIGHVAATGETVVVPDVRQDPRYVNARRQTRSEMVAPIFSNDEVIGVFDLESDQVNTYTEDDKQVLQLLGRGLAPVQGRRHGRHRLSSQAAPRPVPAGSRAAGRRRQGVPRDRGLRHRRRVGERRWV
jgi:putative methionine-R-sulfoxide reductase with GAF domain